jgi:hypothetical protein
MLLGVLLYGGAVYFMRRDGDAAASTPEQTRQLVWIGRALLGAVTMGCIVLWQMVQRTTSPAKRRSLSIIGWAMGEGAALYGATLWFLTGVNSLYTTGLVFLLLTFLVFPVRKE